MLGDDYQLPESISIPLPVAQGSKMPPIVRKIILEQFLKARQGTKERISEKWTSTHQLMTTYMSYDAEGKVLCEDVVVESRAKVA